MRTVNLATLAKGQRVKLPMSNREAVLLADPTYSSTRVRLYESDGTYTDTNIATNILVVVLGPTTKGVAAP